MDEEQLFDDNFDAESDYLLEQTELNDFAADCCFTTVEPAGEGTYTQ